MISVDSQTHPPHFKPHWKPRTYKAPWLNTHLGKHHPPDFDPFFSSSSSWEVLFILIFMWYFAKFAMFQGILQLYFVKTLQLNASKFNSGWSFPALDRNALFYIQVAALCLSTTSPSLPILWQNKKSSSAGFLFCTLPKTRPNDACPPGIGTYPPPRETISA